MSSPILRKLYRFYLVATANLKIVVKIIILDQAVKYYVMYFLIRQPGMVWQATSFLEFIYTWNYGISFGIFREYYQYSNYCFIVINFFIICYIWFLLIRCKKVLEFIGYSFIIGGAISNLIDRVTKGAVFDFIYFHYKDYGLFIFNIADAFISVGGAILLYFYYKKNNLKLKNNPEDVYNKELAEKANKIRAMSN